MITLPTILLVIAIIVFVVLLFTRVEPKQRMLNLLFLGFIILILATFTPWGRSYLLGKNNFDNSNIIVNLVAESN